MKVKISIITVVFNGVKTIEQTILSVLNQTYTNIEYIIIDGCSTDGTIDIIKKYEDKLTKWISESDNGLYDAMNKGISMSTGELIGMINSDDWYEKDAVKLIVDSYIHNPSKKIFHGDRYNVQKDNSKVLRKYHPSRFKFIYYGMTYNHPSMFIHHGIYKKNNYNISLTSLSDYEFVLKQYLKNPSLFFYIEEPYVNYRLDGISSNLSYLRAIQEGFKTRKSAGLNIFQNSFSVILRSFRVFVNRIFSI